MTTRKSQTDGQRIGAMGEKSNKIRNASRYVIQKVYGAGNGQQTRDMTETLEEYKTQVLFQLRI